MLIWVSAAAAELGMGRKLWGIGGVPGFWSGDINSSHNSQFVADPYTFTHVTHGVLLYGLTRVVARRLPLRARFLIALTCEAGWEVLENTDFVIRRYRAATISLHYYGDSVVNSMADVAAAVFGFALAALLPARVSAALIIVMEIALTLSIRDSLLLNIVMLLYPIPQLRHWQSS